MQEIITFTQDELVQMLEGGEVMLEQTSLTTVTNKLGVQFVPAKRTTVFKMEEKDDTSTS